MEHAFIEWNTEVSGCSDSELVAGCQQLVAADHKLGAKLIVYIAEVDARGLFREHAYSSLFDFLAKELHMSEGQAALRMNAARLARRYPVVISLLATGAVHLTALRQISRFLTVENHLQLLERVRGKSKREVEKLVVELDPKPDLPSQMRRLPQHAARGGAVSGKLVAARAQPSVPVAQQLLAATGQGSDASSAAMSGAAAAVDAPLSTPSASSAEFVLEAPQEKRGSCTPLSPGKFGVKITVDEAMHSKLEQLQHLLRHLVPNGDFAVIIELGLDLLLAKTMKERFGIRVPSSKATSPTTSTSSTTSTTSETAFALEPVAATKAKAPKRKSRYIPRAVRREVYERDQGQCSFVSAEGRRCMARGFPETHHVHAFALGGEATVENLQIMCRAHNQLLGERDFGRAHMQSKRSQRGSSGNRLSTQELPHA